jgi:hypothetical protein
MIPQTGTILCIEDARASRCAILTTAGYTAVSANLRGALRMLRGRTFDIVLAVGVSDRELNSVREAAHHAVVFPVGECIPSTVLLFMVDESLRQLHKGRQGEGRVQSLTIGKDLR